MGAVTATCGAFGVMLVIALWQANRVRRFQYEYTRLAWRVLRDRRHGCVILDLPASCGMVSGGYAACLCLLYPMIVLVSAILTEGRVLFLRRIASELGWH